MTPKGAIFSADRQYRYVLWRFWRPGDPWPLFICLNPSTADETQDDPTLRRCTAFARTWGYGGVVVANLFAYRTPDPHRLRAAAGPIGPENDVHIDRLVAEAALVVAAWGNMGSYLERAETVLQRLPNPYCLGTTLNGAPRHPLYLPANLKPVSLNKLAA